jgi:hypothetical protein
MIKISELPSATALGGTEVVAGVQSAATVKVLISQIGTYVRGLFTTTPATITEGGTNAATAAGARTSLGLGTMAVEAAADYVTKALLTTTGDSIVASAASTPARLAATANVAAHATTMNLWAARENILTGAAVTVTAIANAPYAGAVTWVKMNDAHVWTDGATFNVQGNANYTAAADDWIRIYATTVSTFEVTVFKANGTAIVAGTVVQVIEATPVVTVVTCATAIPYDDTIPQNTEGVEVITVSITPTSATNRLRIEFDAGQASINNTGRVMSALFQDTTADALAATSESFGGTTYDSFSLRLSHEMAAGTTSATTFKIRVGPTSGSTAYVNSNNAGSRIFGGVAAARLRVIEIKT